MASKSSVEPRQWEEQNSRNETYHEHWSTSLAGQDICAYRNIYMSIHDIPTSSWGGTVSDLFCLFHFIWLLNYYTYSVIYIYKYITAPPILKEKYNYYDHKITVNRKGRWTEDSQLRACVRHGSNYLVLIYFSLMVTLWIFRPPFHFPLHTSYMPK